MYASSTKIYPADKINSVIPLILNSFFYRTLFAELIVLNFCSFGFEIKLKNLYKK